MMPLPDGDAPSDPAAPARRPARPPHEPGVAVDLTGARMTRTIVALSWPVMVERISISVLSTIDAALVGRYVGADGIAAVGMGGLLFWLALAGAFAVDVGATAVVARDAGARDVTRLQGSAHAAIVMGFAIGVAGAALMWAAGPQLLRLLGADGDVARLGSDYVRVASLGFPLMMTMYGANGALRGIGNTFTPMVILLLVNAANALVAFLLISGVAGLRLETVAAGAGFSVGGAVGGSLALAYLLWGRAGLRIDPSALARTGRAPFARILSIGLPVGLEEFQFMLAFLAYSRIIFSLGETAQAAHAVGLRGLEVAIVPGFALGTASTAIVGQFLGARRPDLAEGAATQVRNYALGIMVVMAVALAALAPRIVGLFVREDDVVDTGARLLRVFALALPGMALHASLSGPLRAGGDARFVLGTFTVTAWFVRIPVAALCALGLGWGAPGAWVGAAAENSVRGAVIWMRFRSGVWKTREV